MLPITSKRIQSEVEFEGKVITEVEKCGNRKAGKEFTARRKKKLKSFGWSGVRLKCGRRYSLELVDAEFSHPRCIVVGTSNQIISIYWLILDTGYQTHMRWNCVNGSSFSQIPDASCVIFTSCC